VVKASETAAAAEMVGNAPNKMSFSEQLQGCQRLSKTKRQGQRQSQRRRDGLIKLRLSPS
jgi:hypothetical protein